MKKFLAVLSLTFLFSLAAHADKLLYGAWWTTSTPGSHGAAKPAGALNVTLVGYDGLATTGNVNLDSEDATTVFSFPRHVARVEARDSHRSNSAASVRRRNDVGWNFQSWTWRTHRKMDTARGVAKGSFQTTEN